MTGKIDKEKCIGCGTCVALAPNSFKWDESGMKAEFITSSTDEEKIIKDVVIACPVEAIILE